MNHKENSVRLTMHWQSERWHSVSALAVVFMVTVLGWARPALAEDVTPPDAVMPPTTELKGLADKMQQRLGDIPYTENQDYNFALLMRSVLQDELDIAENQMMHGADATLRSVAKEVASSRKKEIEKLDRWIEKFQKFN